MKKMSLVIGAISVGALSACTPNDMLILDPMGAMDLMTGQGSVARTQSGETTFRFAIPANAFDGLIDDPQQVRQQRELMLSQWVGREGICQEGYSVNEQQEVQGIVVYEGRCNPSA
jgi:hypothetical protein